MVNNILYTLDFSLQIISSTTYHIRILVRNISVYLICKSIFVNDLLTKRYLLEHICGCLAIAANNMGALIRFLKKVRTNDNTLNPREPCATPVLHDIKLVINWISFKLA